MSDKLSVRVDPAEIREGILDYQVQNCPTCNTEVINGFGLAGGGFGVYGYCPQCERVVWKCSVEE